MKKAVAFRKIMNDKYDDHPHEDALERFLLNQAAEDELEVVETHIMACDVCVTRLETLEFNIAATKLALLECQQAEQRIPHAQSAPKAGFLKWLTIPRLSIAGASFAACTLAVAFVSVPRTIDLTAMRGAEINYVPEWLPLDAQVSAEGATPGPLTVEVVDARGAKVWLGSGNSKGDQLRVHIPRLTAAGQYFIRVYSNQTNAGSELLREYAVQTKPLF